MPDCSDAFTKREQASEDYFVRQKEMEKLQALKDKIAGHQKHLEDLDKHVYVVLIYKCVALGGKMLIWTNTQDRADQLEQGR